ncbi:MAG: low molecular weight protein arginine phosphatase [Tuberibacillus sp.]
MLFVCTGNTCRSPMAEALLKDMASEYFEVKSAGLVASDGQDAYPHVKTVLQKRGIDINHRSQRITPELVAWADMILTMTQGHKAALVQQYPERLESIMTLKEAVQDEKLREAWQEAVADYEMKRVLYDKAVKDQEPEAAIRQKEYDVQVALDHLQKLEENAMDLDIMDPYGAPEETYEKVCREIEEYIHQFMQKHV